MRLSESLIPHLTGASALKPGIRGHILPDLLETHVLDVAKREGHISAGQGLTVFIHMNPSPAGEAPEHLRAEQIGQSSDPGAFFVVHILMEALQPQYILVGENLALMRSPAAHSHDLV